MIPFDSPTTVLLVDDEPSIRDYVGRCLRDHGYSVLEAADASAALGVLQTGARIDLLLTDVVMPGINGLELAAHFNSERADAPVVLMSAYVGLELPKHVSFLHKPFTPQALLHTLEQQLERNGDRHSA